ncbi:MAG TPA: hypothetical protein VK395_05755 [Gemmataceae bacterium]|nr:hypothetical protein [Gemmataceae bacterium]
MRGVVRLTLGLAVLLLGNLLRAEETPTKSHIVSVGLFKNGLAFVKREVTAGRSGTYVVDDVPEPVHGTYWVESTVPVETIVKTSEVDVPAPAVPGNLQEDLAGKKVLIHFKAGSIPPTTGTVITPKPSKPDRVRAREALYGARSEPVATPSRFLLLQTTKGRVYVESSEIAYIEAEGAADTVKRPRSRLLVKVGNTEKAQNKIFISYLTHGISWAPSYRVDISDPKVLGLEQQAVVKNELTDLDNAEIQLISGFPSVQFANVTSPLSPQTNWANFFQQLSQATARQSDVALNQVMGQMASNLAFSPSAPSLAATPAGEGVDLHYQSIGKQTLGLGDSLALKVAGGKAAYERIVEWLVPDSRDEYGRHADGRGRGDYGDENSDSAWDALKFKNPFDFPMTTGPAEVVADGRFNGQRTSYWVNSGEETVLRVNKALSIRTRSVENEDLKNGADTREIVWIGGRQFRKSTVQGELSISNHRKETVRMVVRRRFSGDLVHADDSPKSSLREEGVYSVNKRNELLWNFTLKGGEEKKLAYTYTVLTMH